MMTPWTLATSLLVLALVAATLQTPVTNNTGREARLFK